jgi:triphosphoribosyl-dephospho-CoA synthase
MHHGLEPSFNPALQNMARSAVRALYCEVALEPKPGLVSFRDNGSHHDMQAATFVKSLFALRHYFVHITRAGALGHPFAFLQSLGIVAEERMLQATAGVNTHRGAVFALGLLCAAGGRVVSQSYGLRPAASTVADLGENVGIGFGLGVSASEVQATLLAHWGVALRLHADAAARRAPTSNGQRAARALGLRSAAEEAAQGFPTLFETTLPALQAALSRGHAQRAARVQALFATMAVLDDTNVAHRGGADGVEFVKTQALAFLRAGGVDHSDWLARARAFHAACVHRRLSPGGSADVLAAACWLEQISQPRAELLPALPTYGPLHLALV